MLVTERLMLRPWWDDDWERMAEISGDPEVMRYYPAPLTREESDRAMARMLVQTMQDGFGAFAVEAPRVSILMPVYNELDVTVECLLALQQSLPEAAIEIIVADDCSTDPDVQRLAEVPGLVYLRQDTNAGFIGNCNAAFGRCRGEYVLLLNNDTQVMPGAIDLLVAALDADATIGAAGPKLIYPDGRVQEAGCILKRNGEAGMVGLFADPKEGGYCYDRDVPYISGAALMVRRGLVGETLFDPVFKPAYCEDADLCLRLIDRATASASCRTRW